MAPSGLLRTSAFARAASLSVKALRLYHEMGLLVPSVVDPDSGYRAYSPAQLTDATIIRLLREVGVSLPDIRGVLDARDVGAVRKLLTEQAARFQTGLDTVAQLVDDLCPEEEAVDRGGVTIRREPACLVLAVHGSPMLENLGPFLLRTGSSLQEAATAAGAVVEGCLGATYPPQLEEDRQEVTAFLPIRGAVMVTAESRGVGVRVDELPACDVAVLRHHGPYWGLEACYRRLGAWVAFHAVPADLPVRENYVTPLDGPQEDAVTELLWPVVLEGAS